MYKTRLQRHSNRTLSYWRNLSLRNPGIAHIRDLRAFNIETYVLCVKFCKFIIGRLDRSVLIAWPIMYDI